MNVLGLMSGTSYDAIDAAIGMFSLCGDTIELRPQGFYSEPIPAPLRERIAGCLPPAKTTIAEVCQLDTMLGQAFATVAANAIAELAGDGVDLIACHGQTVYHWVEQGRCRGTLQLGSPAWIAERTGTMVVSDLRSRDVASGGHGAPLASKLDSLLLMSDGNRRGVLNLGGIANISLRDPASSEVIAFDIGPANALIDAAVVACTGGGSTMDVDGALAMRGHVDATTLQLLLDEPYYRLQPPKSTGKELFNAAYLRLRLDGLSVSGADLVSTLTQLTVQLVADVVTRYELDELVVSGGGVRNPELMRRIGIAVAPAQVRTTAEFGLDPQAKEAYLVALLGYLASHGLDTTVASATGARKPSITGMFIPGVGPLRLPVPVAEPPTKLEIIG